jgi:hypothetical protein
VPSVAVAKQAATSKVVIRIIFLFSKDGRARSELPIRRMNRV